MNYIKVSTYWEPTYLREKVFGFTEVFPVLMIRVPLCCATYCVVSSPPHVHLHVLQAFDADTEDTALTQEHFLSIADVSCRCVGALCIRAAMMFN